MSTRLRIIIDRSLSNRPDFKGWENTTMHEVKDDIESHIANVRLVLEQVAFALELAADNHDHTKLGNNLPAFIDTLRGKNSDWWEMHQKEELHHLAAPDVLDTVTLVDILEHIADCVVAGAARRGVDDVYMKVPSDEILRAAFVNTFKAILSCIEVGE